MASSTSKCRGCLNKANSFCFVCGDFTTVAQRRTVTSLIRTAYFHYFDCKISDQDKSWAPHICCKPCYNGLTAWFNRKKAAFNFAVPMVWREQRNHADDCYFCLTNIVIFWPSPRPKNAIPRWYTGRKWHIPMASNRKRSRGRIKVYDMGQGEGPIVPLQWCTGRE